MQAYDTDSTKNSDTISILNRPGSSVAIQISKLKAFAPISSLICELQGTMTDDEASSVGSRLMYKVEEETATIFKTISADAQTEGWAQGQIAPVVADLVAQLYRKEGDSCFNKSIAAAISPTLLTNIEISVPSVWRYTGSRVLIIDSMLNALASFRAAFETNSLGFVDVEDATNWAKTAIFDGAQHAVRIVQTEVPCGTSGDPVILLRAMIKQSGFALADAWTELSGQDTFNSESPLSANDLLLEGIKFSHLFRLDSSIDRICEINDDLNRLSSFSESL